MCRLLARALFLLPQQVGSPLQQKQSRLPAGCLSEREREQAWRRRDDDGGERYGGRDGGGEGRGGGYDAEDIVGKGAKDG